MKIFGKKKSKIKYIFRIIIILLICVVAALCISYIVVQNVGDKEFVYISSTKGMDDWEKRDAAIVPCASVVNGVPMTKGKDRCNAAIALYQAGLIEHIIVSGGTEDEVCGMAQYLMSHDIPQEAISLDSFGIDTYETISRIKEKNVYDTYYFCTQETFAGRARYLMEQLDMDGQVVCVDVVYYLGTAKTEIREFFAAAKAVAEPIIYGGKTKTSISQSDFIAVPDKIKTMDSEEFTSTIEETEIPKDLIVVDANLEDEYDVVKTVEYARKYSIEANPEYPLFEQNCTNFVSQCLLEGGIEAEGSKTPSKKERYSFANKSTGWYSNNIIDEKTGLRHYSSTANFYNTDKFIKYITEDRGYRLSVYNNNYDGRLRCYEEINSGDIVIFYGEDGGVVHLGIVTGVGDMNAYYCGNTNAKRDFSIFTINDKVYPKFGIVHMSE